MPPAAVRRMPALVHITVAQRRGDVSKPVEVRIVARGFGGEEPVQRVVEIVGPVCVQAQSTAGGRANQPRIVHVALGDQHEVAVQRAAQLLHRRREFFQHVQSVETEYRMHRIETQSVESIVAQPHQRVVDDEAAHLIALRPIEVERGTPAGAVPIGEIGAIMRQVVSVGPQVIVNHVEEYAEPRGVASAHERRQLARRAVRGKRSKEIHTVVAPSPSPGKRRQRHQLHMGDAQADQVGKLRLRARVGALGRECADVQFVDDRIFQRLGMEGGGAGLVRIPWRRRMRIAVHAAGLPRRTRIRNGRAPVDRIFVALLQESLVGLGLPRSPIRRPQRNPPPRRHQLHRLR